MAQENTHVEGMQGSGRSHRLSIALTIGATIGLMGMVLLLYGLFGKADYSRSDSINVNFWWGLVMLVSGLLMSIGGAISGRRQRHPTSIEEPSEESRP